VSDDPPQWAATISVRLGAADVAEFLERALRPEADREVPRARASLARGPPDTVVLSVHARDTGALRAALNTYLGWVDLSLATLRSVGSSGAGSSPG